MPVRPIIESGANKPSRGKRVLFRALAVALPLLVLMGVEGGFRWRGWGGYPALIREAGRLPSGERLCIVEPAAAKPYFFANPSRPGYAEQSNLTMPKPAGVVRIFVAGESAAKGYPQPANLVFSAFLQEMLQGAWPERKVEVVNLGITAVASFPLSHLVRGALEYDPDLVVFYMGNNEFFGAYGTGSLNAAGTLPPWVTQGLRALRGLGVVQWEGSRWHAKRDENRTLMEEMVGREHIPAASALREAAARNLRVWLGEMLEAARTAGVASIVCTTASNESGLAPLGEEDVEGLSDSQRMEVKACLAEGLARLATSPAEALRAFGRATNLAPRHASAHYWAGRANVAAGDVQGARHAFLAARDLDTMPWRPISATEEAIRLAAREHGAVLCDVAERFRQDSAEGATGWEKMDDHVHLSLRGQIALARLVVEAMAGLPEGLKVSGEALERLPDDETLMARLGANVYDEYRVNHTMRVLFGVPFMKRANAEVLERYERACRKAEAGQSPGVLEAMRQWQTERPHAGGLRPIAGMVARVLLRENRLSEALALFEIAAKQVPEYTSWHLEYVYFMLACREKVRGRLSAEDLERAEKAIEEGRFLLANGMGSTGYAERYVGRLLQLRGEWAEAIPLLKAARERLADEDLVACDQALLVSYMKTGRPDLARALAQEGIRSGGRFAPIYRRLMEEMDSP